MPSALPHANRPRPWPTWLLIALLHALVAALIWKPAAWADRRRPQAAQPALQVTLLEMPRPPAAPQPPRDAPQPRRPRPEVPLPSQPRQPEAITWPAEAAASPGATVGATTAPAPPASATVAPLNLALPRGASAPWRQRQPALDDPRANTPKLTLEQKLANAMGGDGSWQPERLDMDRIRYRRGDDCILVTRSRAGQLELGNGAFRHSWLVSSC